MQSLRGFVNSKADIEQATRDELVAYLESWGFQCYDSETADDLRKAAIDNFESEGPGNGPCA